MREPAFSTPLISRVWDLPLKVGCPSVGVSEEPASHQGGAIARAVGGLTTTCYLTKVR